MNKAQNSPLGALRTSRYSRQIEPFADWTCRSLCGCCRLLLRPAALLLSSSHPSSLELVKLSSDDINVCEPVLVTQIHPDWAETGARVTESFHNSAVSLFVFQSIFGSFQKPACLWWNGGDQGCIRQENLHRYEHDKDPLRSGLASPSLPHRLGPFLLSSVTLLVPEQNSHPTAAFTWTRYQHARNSEEARVTV